MKFIGSLQDKYFGVKIKGWVYYVALNHPNCRDWGYTSELYNGSPIRRISAYLVSYQWHWDYGKGEHE